MYSAMWAMLVAVKKHNTTSPPEKQIKTVACAGLGAMVGRVPPKEAARQMALAWENFINFNQIKTRDAGLNGDMPPNFSMESVQSCKYLISWETARERQRKIKCRGNGRIYQFGNNQKTKKEKNNTIG
eukprot:TRINITY_DN13076_c0_g1_i1.p1 TRINITY_DN13076_c0_g1~~TRINITY_DN13076_c0_g1_i1.p1  ORF type:complete len:147 (-),score=19.37 TRINITY_DN13076_c0_g1_i1:122-505(-)